MSIHGGDCVLTEFNTKKKAAAVINAEINNTTKRQLMCAV